MNFARRVLASNLAVFGIALIVCAVGTRGRPVPMPDTGIYVAITDDLLAGNFASLLSLQAMRWTKLTFLTVMLGARVIAPEHWMFLILIVNVFACATATMLLVDLVRRATHSSIACAVALALYLTSFDVQVWVGRILTDTLYTLIAFIPFYLLCRAFLDQPARGTKSWLPISILGAALSRPPGVLLVPLIAIAKSVLSPDATNVRRRRAIVLVFVGCAVVALLWRTWIVQDPTRWPFRFLDQRIAEFAEREKSGEVIYDRREANVAPPLTCIDHLEIQSIRFARFFQVTSSGFSRLHNLVSLASFGAMYLLAVIALISALRDGDRRRRSVVLAAILWIFALAFFHAITILDFDWRFRAPLIPHFVFLAGCGASVILSRLDVRDHAISSR